MPAVSRGGALAALALAGLMAACTALTVEAALARTHFIASSTLTQTLPSWLVGPLGRPGQSVLGPLGLAGLTGSRYTILFGVMALCYLGALAFRRHVSLRWALTAIIGVHLVIFLGPPMLSPDVFGYIAYARLGVLHGFAPYLWGPGSFPTDSVFPFLQAWKSLPSPYGPLFTLASYVVAPLPVPVALWAFKLAGVGASLGTVYFVVACARRLRIPQAPAAMFVGLNPLLLEWAVGGAHNDLATMFLVAAGIYCAVAARERSASAAIVAATALKATAGLVFPFALLGSENRRRALMAAAVAAAVCCGLVLVVFGSQVLGYVHVLGTQSRMVSAESLPNFVSWVLKGGPWFGPLSPTLFHVLRTLGTIGFVATTAVMLLRTWRGADWITCCGWSTLALLLSTTWLLPWYIVWVLPFAALGKSRALRYATLGLTAFMFLTRIPIL